MHLKAYVKGFQKQKIDLSCGYYSWRNEASKKVSINFSTSRCTAKVKINKKGSFNSSLTFSVGSAFATAIIPTLEYVHESDKFNTVATRPESFWGKVLAKMSSGDEFPPGDNVMISRDLQSPTLRVKLGWVIYLIWVGSGFALGAVVLIVLAAPR